ncbi:MAG: endonuclease domain-containing protein [Candidatus Nomurabacteria bacterium]
MKREKFLVKNELFLPYDPKLKDISRDLRKNQTEAEKKIWNEYLSKLELNVMRQKIIGYFIVDFYIAKLKLIIEIDGEIHEKLKERDMERSLFLQKYNLKIIRITNKSILNNSEKTYKKLDEILNSLKIN